MLRNKIFSIFIYAVIALAIFGCGYSLISNPAGFFNNIIMMAGIAAVVGIAAYLLFFKRPQAAGSSDMKKYKQAVKQSRQKYKKPNAKPETVKQKQLAPIKKKPSKKRASHLRVIEGQKTEKKDRALF